MRRKKHRARRADKRLLVESLEERQLLTAVTSAADAGPGTLRAAAGSNDGTITFALPMGTDTITLSSGEIVISNSVSIDGNDPVNGNITVDANGTSRVFYIDDGNASYGNVSISNLTVTGGYSYDGGGIQSFENLTLDNVTVTGNNVVLDPVDPGPSGDAGGIGHGNETRTAGDLVIMNSMITNNSAADDAAAIDHYNAANFTLVDSEVSGNSNGIEGGSPGLGGVVGAIRVIDLNTVTSPPTTATVDNVTFDSNEFVCDGEVGYCVGLGTLLITDQNGLMTTDINNITITNTINNIIPDPGGINASLVQGGGLTLTDMASATVSNSSFTDTEAGYGGGLFISNPNYVSDVTLNNVLISGNSTTSQGIPPVDPTDPTFFPPGGAGLFINSSNQLVDLTVTVNDSAITGNSSEGVGGGIYVYRSQLTLNNTTVSGNTAGTKGGAIFMNGGFYNYPNPSDGGLYLNYSTITDNSAADAGGGVYLSGYYGSYGYGNYQQSYLTLNHTIVSGNQAATAGPDIYDFDANNASGPGCPCDSIKAVDYSIVGDNSGTMLTAANPVPNADGSLIGEPGNLVDAGLNPLADNGGDTLTHSLMSGSVALNAGDPAAMAGVGNVPEFDQRGDPYTRVLDDRIDIGAHEGEGGMPPTPDGDFNDDGEWDCDDINALTAETAAGTNDPAFDLTADMLVNLDDIAAWLAEAGGMNLMSGNSYAFGDATLDGTVDGLDFIEWNNNKFTGNTAWCGGNFNGDGVTDGLDFIQWNNNKFTMQGPIILPPGPTSRVDIERGQEAKVAELDQRLVQDSQRASHRVAQASTDVQRTADRVQVARTYEQVFAQFALS